MAEGEEAGVKNLLTRKIGPLPVAAWAAAAVVIWYIVRKKTGGATAAATTTATGSEPGTEGTDPAGNTGLIDPSTGYVYGTPEDLAALDQSSQEAGGSSGSGGTSSTGTFTTNQAWETAAINYLVSIGEDPTESNSAISAYLGSQTLTTSQQALVNSAILAIGAPPQPPSPSTTTPVVTPPGGGGPYATNPPTGLTTTSVTSVTIGLKWNATAGAQGYTVTYTAAGKAPQTLTVSQPAATISGLTPSTSYAVSVQATPADAGAGSATTTVTTSYGVVGGNPPTSTTGYNATTLQPGQVIQLPYDGVGTAVASKFGISAAHLVSANPGKTASQNTTWQVPYQVQKGDTVTSLAGKFGISVEHLEQVLAQEGVI